MAGGTKPYCQFCNGVKRGLVHQFLIYGVLVWLHQQCQTGYVKWIKP